MLILVLGYWVEVHGVLLKPKIKCLVIWQMLAAQVRSDAGGGGAVQGMVSPAQRTPREAPRSRNDVVKTRFCPLLICRPAAPRSALRGIVAWLGPVKQLLATRSPLPAFRYSKNSSREDDSEGCPGGVVKLCSVHDVGLAL